MPPSDTVIASARGHEVVIVQGIKIALVAFPSKETIGLRIDNFTTNYY